ncbi:hypothetical protein ABMA28_009964 [Loxostege sticticalis]|uniref:RRM domain-containing protein n=1 Tax=Loxostege sticticalis TaxID=481309 RepID=A0ABD0SC07_LOXSC
MDYVVGSVAALISGNVTPNRPKLIRRALTPTKHQPSPNVTPKSEFVEDRSIFLSPTLQKKKAIVKKSPKRIFQNPDLDVTSENENNSSTTSPKAEKVKKHLKDKLDADVSSDKSLNTTKSPKKHNNSEVSTPKKTKNQELDSPQSANETTPKKHKKNKKSGAETSQLSVETVEMDVENKQTKKNKKRQSEINDNSVNENEDIPSNLSPSKKKKKLSISQDKEENESNLINSGKEIEIQTSNKSPKKKNKKKKPKANKVVTEKQDENQPKTEEVEEAAAEEETKQSKKKTNKKENIVNPNAVTDKDSDSEHESDDEIVSENEEANKEMLDTGPAEESSDEEDSPEPKKPEKKEKTDEPRTEEEIKRTLFVGNVLFNKKCKKEIKKIFSKYGDIETVRIRTVPVKDGRVTPKVAVIKNELHPERTTVNVYVKYKDPSSVDQALVENNTVLNDCHLRVTRSDSTGAEHDPRCAIFVGNVPFAMEDEALRAKFEQCGEIESVRIIRDKKTNAGKGFAYVNFSSKDGVELALALSEEDLTVKNRILRVQRCTQLTQRQKNEKKGKSIQGKNQNFQAKNQNFQPKTQHFQPRNQNFQRNNQGGRNVQNRNQFGNKGGFKPRQGQNNEVGEGAHRRIMNKRKNQDGSDGPPNKRPNQFNQPPKEKKTRKEFVGMTAEKKKKHTFNKGQKKRKALSEILTK